MHDLTVKELMTFKPQCVDVDENMLSASRIMLEKNFRHLLVTDKGELVGILSDRDVNRAIRADKTKHHTMELRLSDRQKVKDYMNWPVYTISESSSAKYALEQMLLQKVSAIAVENKTREIIGIITTEDLLGHLLILLQREEESHAPQF
jgi:CBS domain-containing protein